MVRIDWTQHPVGHGGFHTGAVWDDNDNVFNWVFDCGSKQERKFDTYLKSWTRTHRGPIDWLFVSHFDSDHANGLDTFMARAVVRNVMIPYVNERELLYLLLQEISRGNLRRSLFELVADPAEFFLARGAEKVTFLNGGGSRGEPRDPESPRDEDGDKDGDKGGADWRCTVSPAPRTQQRKIHPKGWVPDPRVQEIDASSCEVTAGKGVVGLRLKPYRAPIPVKNHSDLLTVLTKLVGPATLSGPSGGLGAFAYAIARHARTAVGRAELRATFKAHAGSSNRASLSLMSIPITNDVDPPHWWVRHPYLGTDGTGTPAWINTGDAELLDPNDLADWENCYVADLADVRVLALPHHGSDRNSDKTLQDLCTSAILAIHVRSNSSKHPGPKVELAADTRLQLVTEDVSTRLDMRFYA